MTKFSYVKYACLDTKIPRKQKDVRITVASSIVVLLR